MKTTTVFKKNLQAYNAGVRKIVDMGGTSSSKTFSILQLLLLIARKRQGVTIDVVSESMPHLKAGAIKDFKKILLTEGLYNENNINFTDQIYYFGDSYIKFFSADQAGKVTGPRRDILYINECNNISYDRVSAMELRTEDTIFYDFNPTAEFWIVEEVFTLPKNEYILIKSNYLDNEQLPDSIKREIELKAQRDPRFKAIHIDVNFGTYEGLVLPKFNIVPALPKEYKWICNGLDFGFTNDPSALIKVAQASGELWIRQHFYRTGMTNQDISREMKTIPILRQEIIADSAEPKSIVELQRMGWNIKACYKGKDSINSGIDLIKQYPLNVTADSLDVIKELRNYSYKKDVVTNKFTNEPIDNWNHAIDPLRYVAQEKLKHRVVGKTKFHFTVKR